MEKTDTERLIVELEALKKLKVLEFLDRGYSQGSIGPNAWRWTGNH